MRPPPGKRRTDPAADTEPPAGVKASIVFRGYTIIEVGDTILQNLDFTQDIEEHKIYSSVILHF